MCEKKERKKLFLYIIGWWTKIKYLVSSQIKNKIKSNSLLTHLFSSQICPIRANNWKNLPNCHPYFGSIRPPINYNIRVLIPNRICIIKLGVIMLMSFIHVQNNLLVYLKLSVLNPNLILKGSYNRTLINKY